MTKSETNPKTEIRMASADRKIVAQVSNLLYRRLPVGKAQASTSGVGSSRRLRIGNPRYGRLEVLEVCATEQPPRCVSLSDFGFSIPLTDYVIYV
jgi:hypothetical protein